MEIWPRGPWFGLNARNRRRILQAFRFTLLAVLVMLALTRVYVLYASHRTESLLEEVRRLEPGHSTATQARELMAEYGGMPTSGEPCTDEQCEYRIETGTVPALNKISQPFVGKADILGPTVLALTDNSLLNHWGFRLWEADVSLHVKNGTVQGVSAALFVETSCHQWLNVRWGRHVTMPDEHLGASRGGQSARSYLFHEFHLHYGEETGEGARFLATKKTDQDHVSELFRFNPECLTAVGSCFGLRELIPVPARRVVAEYLHTPYKWVNVCGD